MSITANNNSSGAATVRIQAAAVDNASAPADATGCAAPTRTTAYEDWTLPTYSSGTVYASVDITAVIQELATAGFTMQAAVPLNNFGKNLIDMYLVVDTMDTLVDGQEYSTYVLVTGDRDFVPLIHALRRRGKHVIGVGLKHTTSESLMGLCDEYVYYEEMLPVPPLSENEAEVLLTKAVDSLLVGDERVRASVVKERMIELSGGQFGRFQYSDTSFSKFLNRYPGHIIVEKDGTTTYIRRVAQPIAPRVELRFETLNPTCPLLGVLPELTVEVRQTWIGPGDMLVLYTDGIVEAFDDAYAEFGRARLEEIVGDLLRQHPQATTDEVRETIISSVRAFAGSATQVDDMTLLIIRRGDSL